MNKLLRILFLFYFMTQVQFGFAQNADIRILRSINLERNTGLDPFFKTVTHSASPLSFGIPVSLFAISFIDKDIPLRENSIYIAASVFGAAATSTTLKYLFDRDRPYVTYPDLDVQTTGASSSFPSGHTTVAFATATSISLAYPKWYYIAPAYIWAGSVGYSRMHLGVHYPSDVLGGAAIGAGSAFVCYKIKQHLEKRRDLKRTNKSDLEIIP